MKRDQAVGAPSGGKRGRRLLIALAALLALLAASLLVVRVTVADRARRLEERINIDRRAAEAAAGENAAAFERYLEEGAGTTRILDGAALTRFIDGRYGSRIPPSVSAWRVVLEEGTVTVEGVVDLDRYLREMGFDRPTSLAGIGGQDIPFSFSGRLVAAGGRGRFTVEEVLLLGLPLPLDLVERVAGSGGDEGRVLVQEFTLPRGIRRAEIDGDRMVINGLQTGS